MSTEKFTPAQLAQILFNFGARDPEKVRARYLEQSADMRGVAAKARQNPKGKHRNYTAVEADRLADYHARLAVEVPVEFAKLLQVPA